MGKKVSFSLKNPTKHKSPDDSEATSTPDSTSKTPTPSADTGFVDPEVLALQKGKAPSSSKKDFPDSTSKPLVMPEQSGIVDPDVLALQSGKPILAQPLSQVLEESNVEEPPSPIASETPAVDPPQPEPPPVSLSEESVDMEEEPQKPSSTLQVSKEAKSFSEEPEDVPAERPSTSLKIASESKSFSEEPEDVPAERPSTSLKIVSDKPEKSEKKEESSKKSFSLKGLASKKKGEAPEEKDIAEEKEAPEPLAEEGEEDGEPVLQLKGSKEPLPMELEEEVEEVVEHVKLVLKEEEEDDLEAWIAEEKKLKEEAAAEEEDIPAEGEETVYVKRNKWMVLLERTFQGKWVQRSIVLLVSLGALAGMAVAGIIGVLFFQSNYLPDAELLIQESRMLRPPTSRVQGTIEKQLAAEDQDIPSIEGVPVPWLPASFLENAGDIREKINQMLSDLEPEFVNENDVLTKEEGEEVPVLQEEEPTLTRIRVTQQKQASGSQAFQEGLRLQSQGKTYQAIRAYKQAVSEDARDFNSLHHLAMVYQELEDWNMALAYYEKALDVKPHHPPSLNGSGLVYIQKNQPEEAEDRFWEAIAWDLKSPDAYVNLAILYRRQKDHDASLAVLNQVLTLVPRSAAAYYHLAQVYEQLGKISEAKLTYEQFLRFSQNRTLNARVREYLEQ